MKLKNKEINAISSVLTSIGNRTSDIKLRFDLAKKIKPLNDEVDIINAQIQQIIKQRNEKDENITSLKVFDEEYIELMDYENEIDFCGLKLEYLSQFNPTVSDLCVLEKVIVE